MLSVLLSALCPPAPLKSDILALYKSDYYYNWPPEPTSIHLATGRWYLLGECLPEGPAWWSHWFSSFTYSTCQIIFLSHNQLCQSTEENSNNDPNKGKSTTGLIFSWSTHYWGDVTHLTSALSYQYPQVHDYPGKKWSIISALLCA